MPKLQINFLEHINAKTEICPNCGSRKTWGDWLLRTNCDDCGYSEEGA